MSFSRRTHIVRIHDDAPNGGGSYIDVEILDAISFRVDGNKEVVLNMDQTKAVPFIVDDTGGGHGKTSGGATQRTHMKRVTGQQNPNNMLDIEVVDCAAFDDQNGGQWVLDMQNGSGDSVSAFNVTDGSGNTFSTRRVHNEIIAVTAGAAKADAGSDYLTSVRSDTIAFRKVNGHEVILNCPSSDDAVNSNTDFGRAATFVTPQGYDPNDPTSPEPPTLDASGDAHVYAAFVDSADGFLTDDATIAMGPFWWIRKITAGYIMFVEVNYSVSASSAPSAPSIKLSHMSYRPGLTWDILGTVNDVKDGVTNIPAVVNPVTDAMLAAYNQWTPAPKVEKRNSAIGVGETLYFLKWDGFVDFLVTFTSVPAPPSPTKDNYLQVYTYDIGNGPETVNNGATIGTLWNTSVLNFDVGSTSWQTLASTAGFDPVRLATLSALPVFSNKADADYYLAALLAMDQAHISLGAGSVLNTLGAGPPIELAFNIAPPGSFFTLAGTAVFAVNIGNLKPSGGKVTFQVDVAGSGAAVGIGVSAEVYRKLRDFSLDVNNSPNFLPWAGADPLPTKKDGGKFGNSSVSGTSVSASMIGTIDLKTLDVTFA